MITLYQFANSVCCQKVRVTMAEKCLEWNTIEVNLKNNEQYRPEYLALNPSAVVPTLDHDGAILIESTLICEYLEELFPEPHLMPLTPYLRAQARLWSKIVDEGLHEGVAEISFSAVRDRLRNMSGEERRVFFDNVGDPRRRDRFMSTFELGPQSPFVLHAVAAFERAFRRMQITLSRRGPWMMGRDFSLADVNLMPYVARLKFLGLLDLWIENKPEVSSWWQHVEQRPSFKDQILMPMREEVAKMSQAGALIRTDIGNLFTKLPDPMRLSH